MMWRLFHHFQFQAPSTSNVGYNITNACFEIFSTFLSRVNFSGPLRIAHGGTNATSFSNNTLIAFDGTRLVSTTTPTFGNFHATSTIATSTISTGGLAVGTSQFVVQQNSGNVGIGTTGPGRRLEITSLTTTSHDAILRLNDLDLSGTTGDVHGAIEFYSNDASRSE